MDGNTREDVKKQSLLKIEFIMDEIGWPNMLDLSSQPTLLLIFFREPLFEIFQPILSHLNPFKNGRMGVKVG